jgi:hypothetical protein
MPKRVLAIGLLFCLAGLGAAWDVLHGLSSGKINLNFAVCLLPVGIGLLRGKARSCWWARFWIILGYISCGLLLALPLAAPHWARASLGEREVQGSAAIPFVLAFVLVFAVLLYAVHRLLYSGKAQAYFA